MTSRPIVDVHAHLAPPGLAGAVRNGGADLGVEVIKEADTWRFAIAGGAPTRPLKPALVHVEKHLEWMKGAGVTHQVVGTWADLFGYELDAERGERWARLINEVQLAATTDVDGLIPMATVPLQAPERAVKVLADALSDGCQGVEIGTQVIDQELDDPALDPFWEAAADAGTPVFIHPGFCADPRLGDYGLINAVGRGNDTTTTGARLLLGGVLERHPSLTLLLAHGGAGLPGLLGRLARNHELHPDETADPRVGFAKLWFDSIVFDPAALAFLSSVASDGHVLLGSDHPFPIGDLDCVNTVLAAGVAVDDILHGGTALFDVGSEFEGERPPS